MVLAYGTRQSTRDMDALIIAPRDARLVRDLVKIVASERDRLEDWLNDAAKGYLIGLSTGPMIMAAPGIEVRSPAVSQLLAMKLSAWRDDVDIADARRLLQELGLEQGRGEIWSVVRPYRVPGNELKAQYTFADLWESLYGNS